MAERSSCDLGLSAVLILTKLREQTVRKSAQIVGALAFALTSCRDSSGPTVGTVAARITVVSGIPSSGAIAGTTIGPILIQVTDSAGLPVPGTQLVFELAGGISPDPAVVPNPAVTDGEGTVQVHWTLPTNAGTQSVTIRVPSSAIVPPIAMSTIGVPGSLVSFSTFPIAATVAQGETRQLRAQGLDANFNSIDGLLISWTSSNPAVVSVSSSGILTATRPGSAVITGMSQGRSDSSLITVPVPPGPDGPGIPPFSMAVMADFRLFVMRSDGAVEATISCEPDCSSNPAGGPWSRDGRKLAISARRAASSVLYVVNRDGTDLREVASAPMIPREIGKSISFHYPSFYPDWSADGRLVYARSTANGTAIETVAADGTDRRVVMPETAPPAAGPFGQTIPRWGLGDSMISADIDGQLYAMNSDGSNLRPLTPIRGVHVWSPDGKLIAFTQDERAIWVLDPVSGFSRQIPVPSVTSFCWAPNSSGFSVVSTESDPTWVSISTVNLDGSGLQKAVIGMASGFHPVTGAWSPDGKFLIYLDDRTGERPGRPELFAQSVLEGTNTRIGDASGLGSFTIAETRGCPT